MTHNSLRIRARIPNNFVVSIYDNRDRYDGVLLLNEHGDLYFVFHKLMYELSSMG